MEHIAEAEKYAEKLHAEQLAWAASSPEAEQHLRGARKRAVGRVAGRLGTDPTTLIHLQTIMGNDWSLGHENNNDNNDALMGIVFSYAKENRSDLSEDAYSRLIDTWDVLTSMWLDVVVETDEWARRYAPSRVSTS